MLKINSNRTVADLKDEAGVLRQLVEIANHFNIDPSLIRIGEITENSSGSWILCIEQPLRENT